MGREEACRRLAGASLRIIPGIGPKTAERLAAVGLTTIGALQAADEAQLAQRFGARHARELRRPRALPRLGGRRVRVRPGEVALERDDVRPRHRRPRRARGGAGAARRRSSPRACGARRCAGARSRSRSGSTTGPRSRAPARSPAPGERHRDGHRAWPLELLRAYAPPRPVRLLGVRVAAFDGRRGGGAAAAAARRLAPPARRCRSSAWSGSCRGPGSRAAAAVAAVRSYSRPPTNGPRSITGTRTLRSPRLNVTFVPHGSVLCATPSVPGAEAAAAAERVAVQAGAVPATRTRAVDVQPPDRGACPRRTPGAAGDADAHRRAAGASEALAQLVAPGCIGAVAVDAASSGAPRRICSETVTPATPGCDACRDGGAVAGAHVELALATVIRGLRRRWRTGRTVAWSGPGRDAAWAQVNGEAERAGGEPGARCSAASWGDLLDVRPTRVPTR